MRRVPGAETDVAVGVCSLTDPESSGVARAESLWTSMTLGA